jgi:hypothetical protein
MAEPQASRLGARLIAVVMRNQPDFEIDRTGAVVLVATSVIFSPPLHLLKKFRTNLRKRDLLRDDSGSVRITA